MILAPHAGYFWSGERRAGPLPVSACLLLASVVCTLTALICLAASTQFLHWFLLPVTLCGIVIGKDVVNWLLGRTNLFDPAGIVGLLGTYFFFAAPLLHIAWDYWMAEVVQPPDWRDWLGQMALLNLCGLLAYQLTRDLIDSRRRPRTSCAWRLHEPTFYRLAACLLVASALLQVWAYASYGGIMGYIETATDFEDLGRMAGMGGVFVVSEIFPIMALMVFAVYCQRRGLAKGWAALCTVLAVFFVLKMFFGGLRGSRSNTIWGLFWAAGIIHLWLRPISRTFVASGLVALVGFMYFYGLYKAAGVGALEAIGDPSARAELAERSQRTLDSIFLADLGRSDVQAYLLYRLADPDCDYDLAWGRTFAGTLSMLVPRPLWSDPPERVMKEGSELQFGKGSYVPGEWNSSRVYGLGGEAMLNFGPLGLPLAFIALGVAVGCLGRFLRDLRAGDARTLLYPFALIFTFSLLFSDSPNLLFFLIKEGALPFIVLWLSTRRLTTWRQPEHPAWEGA